MTDLTVARVDWFDPRAVALREAMDAETGAMYAEFISRVADEDRAAIDEALRVDPTQILVTFLGLDAEVPVGHTALRRVVGEDDRDALEVKKVFVVPDRRSAGIARRLLAESEQYAIGAGFTALVLQTGPLQEAAIRLYERLGYHPIPAFGDYGVIPGALCFRKVLA